MAEKRDYYEVLGVDKSASPDEIKKAYRRLAKEHHPDANQGKADAEQKFKEINEAYQVLSDSDSKRKYDAYGHAAFDASAGYGGGGGYGGFGGFGDINLDDIFGSFFGGFGGSSRRSYSGAQPGRDLRYDLTITFEEAYSGVKKTIDVAKEERCEVCSGTGAKPGTEKKTCSACGGSGQMRQQKQTAFGNFVNVITCPTCGGEGSIVESPCEHCHGRGTKKKSKKLNITIPAGIDNGQALTLSGEGEPGKKGGPDGDLLIYIHVKPHKYLRRDGVDMYLDMTISYATAALGGDLEVPTLDGKIKYKIPEGTQSGTTFRLKDKGFKHLRTARRGDMFITTNIEVPKKLNDKQKKLLTEFEDSLSSKSYFERVKDAFSKGF